MPSQSSLGNKSETPSEKKDVNIPAGISKDKVGQKISEERGILKETGILTVLSFATRPRKPPVVARDSYGANIDLQAC